VTSARMDGRPPLDRRQRPPRRAAPCRGRTGASVHRRGPVPHAVARLGVRRVDVGPASARADPPVARLVPGPRCADGRAAWRCPPDVHEARWCFGHRDGRWASLALRSWSVSLRHDPAVRKGDARGCGRRRTSLTPRCGPRDQCVSARLRRPARREASSARLRSRSTTCPRASIPSPAGTDDGIGPADVTT
jgi:hypothetical protein